MDQPDHKPWIQAEAAHPGLQSPDTAQPAHGMGCSREPPTSHGGAGPRGFYQISLNLRPDRIYEIIDRRRGEFANSDDLPGEQHSENV